MDLTYVEQGIREELAAYVADQQDYSPATPTPRPGS
jgi:hypothetical protein